MDFFIYYGLPTMRIIRDLGEQPGADYNPVQQLTAGETAFLNANPTASPDEVIALAMTPAPPPTLAQVKAAKIAELNTWYAAKLNKGYYDLAENFTMGLSDSRQARYHRFMDHQKIKVEKGSKNPNSIVTIYSLTGAPKNLTYGAYIDLLERYGDYIEVYEGLYIQKNVAIAQAATIEAVNAIVIPA